MPTRYEQQQAATLQLDQESVQASLTTVLHPCLFDDTFPTGRMYHFQLLIVDAMIFLQIQEEFEGSVPGALWLCVQIYFQTW